MEINVTDRYTEISTGGGKYLTQSSPTMFPEFWTRKILAAGETADDFREVTAAEREKLEAARAAWVRPPQAFIDQWVAAGGTWNEATGYFGLNGITDITYSEAMRIWRHSHLQVRDSWTSAYTSISNSGTKAQMERTYFPLVHPYHDAGGSNLSKTFYGNVMVQVVRIVGGYSYGGIHAHLDNTFNGCTALRRVIFGDGRGVGDLKCHAGSFAGCVNLERIDRFDFWTGGQTLDLSMAPKFQIDCIESCVNSQTAHEGWSNTLILHPDVFAQCTEELMAEAATKYITITTP